MITFLIAINTPAKDFSARHKNFISTVAKYEQDFEVIFLAKSDYQDIDAFKVLASQLPRHHLIVVDKTNNDNERILLGISASSGEDVLLSTLDTKIEVIEKILQKRKDGCDMVFVRKKRNKFIRFFENLGLFTYGLGLKMIGRNKDYYCETRVQLIDGRVANLICASPAESKELRMTNGFKQLKQGVVEDEDVFEKPLALPRKQNAMFSVGWVAFAYIIAFFLMAIVSPFFNQLTYSWWIVLALVIWIGAGILFLVYIAKHIFKHRAGSEIRLNNKGEPLISVTEIVNFGDNVYINPILYEALFPEETEKQTEKAKETEDKTLKTKTRKKVVANKTSKANKSAKTETKSKKTSTKKTTTSKSTKTSAKDNTTKKVTNTKTEKSENKEESKTKATKEKSTTKTAKTNNKKSNINTNENKTENKIKKETNKTKSAK